jgi:hypothetical protein
MDGIVSAARHTPINEEPIIARSGGKEYLFRNGGGRSVFSLETGQVGFHRRRPASDVKEWKKSEKADPEIRISLQDPFRGSAAGPGHSVFQGLGTLLLFNGGS